MALSAAIAVALIGCQSAPPRAGVPPRGPSPEPPPSATPGAAARQGDGSYDWHSLIIAPFGTVLREIPLALHEVLLFRDETHDAGPADDAADCYAADTPAPPFAGRTTDEYVLCFKRDRLARIQASVRLTSAEAPGVFAAACAAWFKNASPAAEAPAAEAPAAETGAAACEGRDGAVRFSGRLGEQADRPDMPPAESMSVILESNSAP